jgi:hypothetical protein
MDKLHALEEAIQLDAIEFRENMQKIKESSFLTKEEDFQKAKDLWFESKKIVERIKRLEYEEEHLLPLVRKRILIMLNEAHDNTDLL